MRALTNVAAAMLLLGITASLSAQAVPQPITFPHDSALFSALRQIVLPMLRRYMANEMAPADNDSERRPLRFRGPPDGDSISWRRFEREIADSVFARPVTALDRGAAEVFIHRAMVSDSMFEGSVDIGSQFFCGNRRALDASGFAIRTLRRSDGSWPPLVPRDESILDAFGCAVKHVAPEKMPGGAARIAWISETYPCPATVPPAWTAVDRSLGKGFRCALVQYAATVVAEARGTAMAPTYDLRTTACVRLVSWGTIGREEESPLGPGDWAVTFYGRDHPGVSVWIDVVTGESSVFPVRPPKDVKAKGVCVR